MEIKKLSEKALIQAKIYAEQMESCSVGIMDLSRQKKEANRRYWDIIKEEYPQVSDLDIHASFNSDTNELVIMKRYQKTDDMKYIEKFIEDKIEDKFNQE